jgi:uncharacterized protein YdhG (YjbR/CyaY superfamily)
MNEVDQYIAKFPRETQEKLEEVRRVIRDTAPEAKEMMAYMMPAYKINKYVVFFAGYKAHVGLYPTPSGIEKFKSEIQKYKWAKGSVQFPLDKPMPIDLIKRIVEFRVEEDRNKNTPNK